MPLLPNGLGLFTKRMAEAGDVANDAKKGEKAVGGTLPGRKGAFREAERDLGIPKSQQLDSIDKVSLTDRNGKNIFDENGRIVSTREYTFIRSNGEKVVIQDHSADHKFGEGGVGDQSSHFNVRPKEQERNGKVENTKDHYQF